MLEYGYEDLDEAERRSGLAGRAGPPLAVDEWLKRDLPVPDFLIGSWFTTTSRLILNAPTGLGKTNFMLAKFAHIAAGIDFLHWKCRRQRRVLFVDGEMSRRLLKQRLEDVVRRLGCAPVGLHLLSHEDVGDFQPLNTVAGRRIIESTIERIGGVDAICFDNIMSLILGDMKEEEAWRETLPLITSLTKRNIGQAWVHHTGHDLTRGYGTKTREWGMDTVLHLSEAKRPDTDVSFILEFRKARERTPETRQDFRDVTIALVNDQWVWSAAADKPTKPSPLGGKFLRALENALAGEETTVFQGWKAAKSDVWKAECVSLGLIDPVGNQNSARTLFNKHKRELIACNLITCVNDLVCLR